MPKDPKNPLWSIILAGGDGERIRPFIEQWLGCHRPKQYCTFVGKRSMLQHTLDRTARLVGDDHKITVIGQHHREFAEEALKGGQAGHLLVQPQNCGTGAGVFLPLTYVQTWEPDATVVIFPSDHFIFPEDRFLETVRRAVRACEIFPDRIFLLGVRPSHLELEYGWINVGGVLGWSGGSCLYQADSFLEKPTSSESLQALAKGAFWNTLVLVAKGETLWKVGSQFLPEIVEPFKLLSSTIGTSGEEQMLGQVYRELPNLNFSVELLQHVPKHIGVIELEEVLWSDWGRPERIMQTLQVLGKEPAFPSEILEPAISGLPHLRSKMEVM